MSRIDELIMELCPEGITFRPLGELVTNRDNERKPVSKGLRVAGQYPYYGANGVQDYVSTYIFDGTFLLVGEDGSVCNIDGTPILNWASGKIWVNNHAHVLQEKDSGPLLRYLYFYLSCLDVTPFITGGTQKKINQANLNRIPVAIPPIEIQKEIVSILDKFTQLEAELEAELEARKTQYEVTRDRLLDFSGDLSAHPLGEVLRQLCPEGVRYLPMGEAGSFIRGQRFVKDDMRSFGEPCIHYGEVYTKYGMEAKQTISFLEADLAKKLRKAQRGDVVIAAAGETVEDIGKPVVWNGDGEVVIHDALYAFKSRMNPKFVAHFLGTDDFKTQARKLISSSKISAISIGNFNKVIIPEPPIEVQREIVSILDKLDALVNDITYGLPAEIEARRKQYEYYRNKLLTFKELDAA